MINKMLDNCFQTELNTRVEEVREDNGLYWHCFRDTIFYQGKGGMADDTGMINKRPVKGLKVEEGRFWHLLDEKLEGNVFMNVNPHMRFLKCQAHTAQHLISALVESIYGVQTVSHHVGTDECYVEFDLCDFNKKMAIELQVTCNGLIRDDLDVTILYPSQKDARQLCPNKKLPSEDIRLVRIGNLDVTPCGCMHVPSLRYLQMVQIIGYEKSSRGYRIRYACGDQLLNNITQRYEVLDEACETLSVPHIYLNTGISKLIAQKGAMQKELEDWRRRYFDKECQDVVQTEKSCLYKRCDGYTAADVRQLAKMIVENSDKAVCFLIQEGDKAKVVIAKGAQSSYDLTGIKRLLMEKFQCKGGGSAMFMEFGGVYSEAMEAALQEMIDTAE